MPKTRPTFGFLRSTFANCRSTFPFCRSSFRKSRSSFPFCRSSFRKSRSSFPICRSTYSICRSTFSLFGVSGRNFQNDNFHFFNTYTWYKTSSLSDLQKMRQFTENNDGFFTIAFSPQIRDFNSDIYGIPVISRISGVRHEKNMKLDANTRKLHRCFIFQSSCPNQIDKNKNIFHSYLHSNKAFMNFGIAYFSEKFAFGHTAGSGLRAFGFGGWGEDYSLSDQS